MAATSDPEVDSADEPFAVREYKGFTVLKSAEIEDFPNFRCRNDDVWVCSFPRSGTTLTQQITYLILTLDFDKATTVELDDRFPLADCMEPGFPYFRGLKHLDSLPDTSPRMIKCHLPYVLLPDGLKNGTGKVIYLARNPKAVCVSYYMIMSYMNLKPAESLRAFVEIFLSGKQFNASPWWEHVKSYWRHKADENVLCIQFEKLIQDRRATIVKIAEFLGRELTSAQVDRIYDFTSLASMKSNKTVNFLYFEDEHEAVKSHGGHINHGDNSRREREFPDDLVPRMDDVIQGVMADVDIQF